MDTLLHLPLTSLCHQDTTDPSITHHNLIRRKPVQAFFEPIRLRESVVFTPKVNSPHPVLLKKLKQAVSSAALTFTPMLNICLSPPSGPALPASSAGGVDFTPYLSHKLNYQSIAVLSMTNTQLCAMYMRDRPPPIARPHVDLNRFTMASFLHNKMPSAARNLWFRLIHNKVSSKANIVNILRLTDEIV
ncbi:hypothetical protein BD408DRAFT_439459 [Parasitella parasitica]|nr:hypothetical protein BD408DRAFT_439459 [Parasitella parasitica]